MRHISILTRNATIAKAVVPEYDYVGGGGRRGSDRADVGGACDQGIRG